MAVKHIVFVTDGLFPCQIGGIQKYSAGLCKQFLASGVKVSILCQQICDNLEPELKAATHAVQHRRFSGFPGAYLLTLNAFSKAVKTYINSNLQDADVVYCQGFTGMGLNAKNLSIPIVHNLHGLEMYQPVKGWKAVLIAQLFRWVANRILNKANHLISLGAKLNEILKSNSNANVYTIPNAVAASWISDNEQNKVVSTPGSRKFLFVGRYEWRKGFDTLNVAIRSLLEKKFAGSFIFVGDVPEFAQINSEKILYAGPVHNESELKKWYRESDVLLCPSYSEGMPTVILEAMASAMPVICTDAGASAELVNNSNGMLVEVFHATELQESIEYFNGLPSENIQQMGVEGQKRVKVLYNWANVCNEHLKVFEQICRER